MNTQTHINQEATGFGRCCKPNLKINADKCHFGVDEIENLDYIITPTGVKPVSEKFKQSKNLMRQSATTKVHCLVSLLLMSSWCK